MLLKKIDYIDYNGNKRSEDFRFNLTQAELMELQVSESGGFVSMVHRIIDTQDMPSMAKLFKELILKSYGEMSPDGKYFMKEDEFGRPLSNKFKYTEAYSNLYSELSSDVEAASKFINGIIPGDLASKLDSQSLIDMNVPEEVANQITNSINK